MHAEKLSQVAQFMEGRTQITANELAEELSCSRQAALKNLKELESKGLLKSALRDSAGKSRATRIFLRTEKPFPEPTKPVKARPQAKTTHKFRTEHLGSVWMPSIQGRLSQQSPRANEIGAI